MITETAKRKVALFLKEFYTEANIGVGGNSPNPNSNSLDVPILGTNKATVNTESSDLIIDFTATFTGSELNGNTVREFGIFGPLPAEGQFDELRQEGAQIPDTVGNYGGTSTNTDGTEATVEETMLARFAFNALGPFSSSDELEIVLTVGVE